MSITEYAETVGYKLIAFWGVLNKQCPHCDTGKMTMYSINGNKRILLCTTDGEPNFAGIPYRTAGCGHSSLVVSCEIIQ